MINKGMGLEIVLISHWFGLSDLEPALLNFCPLADVICLG